MEGIIRAWGRILAGYHPNLSVEITRECPLTCPGCYAYGSDHLGGDVKLRELQDFKGQQLVDAMFALLDKYKPLHVSIVGGEPLVRYRELSEILPRMAAMGIYTQVVTSAVRPIPIEWAGLRRLQLVVSIDGLQPEHDERRKPATYKKILENLQGRTADVSWVVTNQMLERDGYLEEYLAFWTAQPSIDRIWLSVYTPQKGEVSAERLTPASRARLLRELPALKKKYPALIFPDGALKAFASPPASPDACTFARISSNVSADLKTKLEPCFFGGNPDCSECGCAVSAGLHWLREYPLVAGLKAGHLIDLSLAVGRHPRRQVPPRILPMVPVS
jgi:MoaA/NifB/PqqE/SkfB family radical SAM enzyme